MKELAPARWCPADLREVIAELNPILRGWGNDFRTGNAAKKLNQIDIRKRWRKLRVRRKGRPRKPGEAARWTREYFWDLGLHRLRGTVTDLERPFFLEAAECRGTRGRR